MFYVGQKVVCINDDYEHPNWKYIPNRPKKGDIYTIRGIVDFCYKSSRESPPLTREALYLYEVVNQSLPFGGGPDREYAFESGRFKPLLEKKTDISIFTAMLSTQSVKLDEQI
jgi:hypothetical protein